MALRRARAQRGASRVSGLLLGLAAALAALTSFAVAEDIAVTSYFPSPRAVYESLQTIGNTNLAINGGTRVDIGPATGWGEKVNVNGTVQATDYIGFGVPVPGTVMMFMGACPVGWVPAGGMDGLVLRGSPAYGAVGGAASHAHTDDHNHALPPQAGPSTVDGDHTHDGINMDHPHVFCGSSGGGDSAACCDQGCGAFESCDSCARGGHTHDACANTDPAAITVNSDAGGAHFHDFNVTWSIPVQGYGTDNASNWPPFLTVVFCRSP